MKVLVVPDIHTHVDTADLIIDRHPEVDIRVFLGDYFDEFGDTPAANRRAAAWLRERVRDRKNIMLPGNHDLSYMSYGREYICSGYTPAKRAAILEEISRIDFEEFFVWARLDGWVYSHAGLDDEQIEATHSTAYEKFLRALKGQYEPWFSAGRSRGGYEAVGGITWRDWSEFQPVEGVNQIVGHTKGREVRSSVQVFPAGPSVNYCLDTHLKHYALVTDGAVEIKEV